MNENANREARRVIYYHDKSNWEQEDLEISANIMGFNKFSTNRDALVRVSRDIVVNNFDQIGIMIKHGLIPENVFLERYWKSIIDCRWLLNDYVAKLRKNREYPEYLKHFDELRDKACKYAWDKKLFKGEWQVKGMERCPNLPKK